MDKVIEIKEKRMFDYNLDALQEEIRDAISFKKRLEEDLKEVCIDISMIHRDWKNYHEKDREKMEMELISQENKRRYLEDILGFTYKYVVKTRGGCTTFSAWVKAEL
jgi:hypothetical protein